MYRIELAIDPQGGVEDVSIKVADPHRESVEPMKFYLKVKKDIQKFRESIDKTLNQGGRNQK